MKSAEPLKLKPLQRQLERLYAVGVEHDVDDFLITDSALVGQLDTSRYAREVDEKLLVRQTEDHIDVTLYLNAALVARLADDNPAQQLHDGNLVDFCTVLEGVSHFLYLIWNAMQQRSVTLLELELQAEVDKYFTVINMLGRQHQTTTVRPQRRISARLHQRLFEQVSFDPQLTDFEQTRYYDANHYAGKYCRQLEQQFLRSETGAAMVSAANPSQTQAKQPRFALLDELRHFYRLPLRDKIRRIDHEYLNSQ